MSTAVLTAVPPLFEVICSKDQAAVYVNVVIFCFTGKDAVCFRFV